MQKKSKNENKRHIQVDKRHEKKKGKKNNNEIAKEAPAERSPTQAFLNRTKGFEAIMTTFRWQFLSLCVKY